MHWIDSIPYLLLKFEVILTPCDWVNIAWSFTPNNGKRGVSHDDSGVRTRAGTEQSLMHDIDQTPSEVGV